MTQAQPPNLNPNPNPNPPRIDEPSRRLRDEPPGRTIVLPDGQAWTFSEPEPAMRPVEGDDGRPGLALGWTFGADLDLGLDAALSRAFATVVRKYDAAPDDRSRWAAFFEAAWFCLARNYELSREEFEAVLLSGGRADLARLGGELMDLIGTILARRNLTAATLGAVS